jgi:hypothetical protein
MGDAAGDIKADNVTFGVNPSGGCGCGPGWIDGGEGAVLEQEAMANAAGNVVADDIVLGADT